jgi:hypothetical protein
MKFAIVLAFVVLVIAVILIVGPMLALAANSIAQTVSALNALGN